MKEQLISDCERLIDHGNTDHVTHICKLANLDSGGDDNVELELDLMSLEQPILWQIKNYVGRKLAEINRKRRSDEDLAGPSKRVSSSAPPSIQPTVQASPSKGLSPVDDPLDDDESSSSSFSSSSDDD